MKGIFKDTEKDLDEDAAFVSNVVTGDFLSYSLFSPLWESCGLCTFQNVFGWASRRIRRMDQEGVEKVKEKEENVFEWQERVFPILFTGT